MRVKEDHTWVRMYCMRLYVRFSIYTSRSIGGWSLRMSPREAVSDRTGEVSVRLVALDRRSAIRSFTFFTKRRHKQCATPVHTDTPNATQHGSHDQCGSTTRTSSHRRKGSKRRLDGRRGPGRLPTREKKLIDNDCRGCSARAGTSRHAPYADASGKAPSPV